MADYLLHVTRETAHVRQVHRDQVEATWVAAAAEALMLATADGQRHPIGGTEWTIIARAADVRQGGPPRLMAELYPPGVKPGVNCIKGDCLRMTLKVTRSEGGAARLEDSLSAMLGQPPELYNQGDYIARCVAWAWLTADESK